MSGKAVRSEPDEQLLHRHQDPDMRLARLFFPVAFWMTAWAAGAAEIVFEENFMGPFGRSAHIEVEGEIREGDAEKIESFVGSLQFSDDLRIHVSFNSPGGSLSEGLRIGRYLLDLPVTVTTNINRGLSTPGECASACVFAFLGGHYRYLMEGSRLGVHQFYLTDGNDLTANEGVAVSQFLAGEIVEFIGQARVKPEFFSLISSVNPSEILWVPEDKLREFRVITDAIFDQNSEYKNVQGNFYLLLWQQSYYGENKMVAACSPGEGMVGERMVFSSYIQPADIHTFDSADFKFEAVIDGVGIPPQASEPAPGRDARWAITYFVMTPDQLDILRNARSFGARHVHSSGVFLGFEYDLDDAKLSDLISGCQSPAATVGSDNANAGELRTPALLSNPMSLPNVDITGGDFDSRGVKGVNIEECAAICIGIDSCIGFSWVSSSKWCWPKRTSGPQVGRQGVTSFLLQQ